MSTKPFLMGGETEYSLANSGAQRLSEWLTQAIRRRHCWLPDIQNPLGTYLDNGARCYSEVGHHYEFCSPELQTPSQVAVYDRAGEQVLLSAKAALQNQYPDLRLYITKHNINFTCPHVASWGHHESYTCWISQRAMAEQITPHLVSRLPYAGAGFLSSDPRGMGLGLLQRASHIKQVHGEQTTQDRAIFCTRNCKSWDRSIAGWTRAHLLCADFQAIIFWDLFILWGYRAAVYDRQ